MSLQVALALALYEALAPGAAAQNVRPNNIVTDGRTNTALSTLGKVTDVRTNTVSGANAFNSFSTFTVGAGQTVNLHLPTASANLINVVRDQRATVDGVLNSIKNGKIGGNVYFATPNGMLVSSSGVVNVGSLTVTTPTREFADKLFVAPGVPNDAAVAQLQEGKAPRNGAAAVVIDGKVNAAANVTLHAGSINVGGVIYSGARFEGSAPNFTDVVNANGLAAGTRVIERGGRIEIVADNDVIINGTVAAPGGPGVRGGDINILAGNNIELQPGARILVNGDGANSSGGSVYIFADNHAVARKGALVDASAGRTGDGGQIEFSARKTVELAGGEFRADARGGKAGSVLIDPASILVSANILRGPTGYGTLPDGATQSNADITFKADESITVNSDITISSRQVAGTTADDHLNGLSTGGSANITFEAPSIRLLGGARVLAHANNGFGGGDVTLTANKQATSDIAGLRRADALIEIGDAIRGSVIKGKNVTLTATTLVDTRWLYKDAKWVDSNAGIAKIASQALTGILALLPPGTEVVHSQAEGNASVAVKGDSQIIATETVFLRAENNTQAGNAAPGLSVGGPGSLNYTPIGIGLMYSANRSNASATLQDSATLQGKNLTLRAHNQATVDAMIAVADNGRDRTTWALAMGAATADINATATVAAGVNLKFSGAISVAATNRNTFGNSVESQTGASGNAAAAIAVSDFKTATNAALRAHVQDAASIEVLSINDNVKNQTTANARAGGVILDMIAARVNQYVLAVTNPDAATENVLAERLFGKQLDAKTKSAPGSDGSQSKPFRLGGAVAVTNSSADATAVIGSGANLHASDRIVVGARVIGSEITTEAESAAISQARDRNSADTSRQSYSAGVAVGDYAHNALAKVESNAVLTAPLIGVSADTLIPIRKGVFTVGGAAFDQFDRWTSIATLGDWLTTLGDNAGVLINLFDVFNGASGAKAKADGSDGAIALSGSVSFNRFTSNTRAVLDSGVKLNLLQGADAWLHRFEVAPDNPATTSVNENEQVLQNWDFFPGAHVRAAHDSKLLFLGGQYQFSQGASKGLGGAYTQSVVEGVTEAIVREGVVIRGVTETASAADADGLRTFSVLDGRVADSVSITATNNNFILSIGGQAGTGASFGVNGAVSLLSTTNSVRALVDDETAIQARLLNVTANDTPVAWSTAGVFSSAKGQGVGVGIAYNKVTADTHAEIANNDSYQGELTSTRGSLITRNAPAFLVSSTLNVIAQTGGSAATIAVTGAIASTAPDPIGDAITKGVVAVEDAAIKGVNALDQSLLARATGNPNPINPSKSAAIPLAKDAKPDFLIAGAGSAAANKINVNTVALIENADVNSTYITLRGISDLDVRAGSGAAALTFAGEDPQKYSAAITGSVALNSIDSKTSAALRRTQISLQNTLTVQALQGGEQLAVAVGLAMDDGANKSEFQSAALTGSLSLSYVDNDVSAMLDNSTVVGKDNTGAVDVTAYQRTFIGTGGGALATFGKSAAGAAVTYSRIGNAVNAAITGESAVFGVDTVTVAAYNATAISAAAAQAALSVSNVFNGAPSASVGANSLQGAIVITEVTNNTTAEISGKSSVSAGTRVDVLARDSGADVALEQLIEPTEKRGKFLKGIDYCGTGDAGLAAPSGNCITAVAGLLQVAAGTGSSNIGLSFNQNVIDNNLTAKSDTANITVSLPSGGITISAVSDTAITSLAVGAGIADKFSALGSYAENAIKNKVSALSSSSNAAYAALAANRIVVEARDQSKLFTEGGLVSVSTKGAAVGGAVARSVIENAVKAHLSGVSYDGAGLRMDATNNAAIKTYALAGSVVVESKLPVISASIALSHVYNTTAAGLESAALNLQTNGSATVLAEDTSAIRSGAGSIAANLSSAAAGGAFSYNGIGNAVTATISNSKVAGAGSGVSVTAHEALQIENITAGVSGGQTLAFSGSVSLNRIGSHGEAGVADVDGNVARAAIDGSTVSGGAVSVIALDTSSIRVLAGALSGAGTGVAGGAVADNMTRNVAQARVAGSVVTGGSLDVLSTSKSTIETLAAAAAGAKQGAFTGSAASNRTGNRVAAELANSEFTGNDAGVSVRASDTAVLESLSGAAAAAGNAAVGAAISVNRIDNTTDAHVSGVHSTGKGLDVANLAVTSISAESIDTIAVGAAAAREAGVAGSTAINLISNDTLAAINDSAKVLSKQYVGVVSRSDDLISVGTGALGVGVKAVGAAASVIVNRIEGETSAYIGGAGTEVTALGNAASTPLVIASGALKTSPDLLPGITNVTDAFTRPDIAALRATETVTGIAVNASATHHVLGFVSNVGAGTVGVSGMANVNLIGGVTQAYIDRARINGGTGTSAPAQSVSVIASDHAYGSVFAGSVSGGALGAGLTADVNRFDRDTRAYVLSATINARDALDVNAVSSQGLSTLVVAGAAGGAGLVGAGSVVKMTGSTEAYLDGATVTVGRLDVSAAHDTQMLVSGGVGAAGNLGVGASFDVALDNHETRAYVNGSTLAASGPVKIDARSASTVNEWTLAASGGAAAVAGTAGVALIENTTQAWMAGGSAGATRARVDGLAVTASDSVTVRQVAGAGALAGWTGGGAAAGVVKVDNTTSAYLRDAAVYSKNGVVVDALSTRDLGIVAATAGGGINFGLSGSTGVLLSGKALSSSQAGDTNANRELNSGNAGTLDAVQQFTNGDRLSVGGNLNETSSTGGLGLNGTEIDALNADARLNTLDRIYQTPPTSALSGAFDPATQLAGRTAAIIGGRSVIDVGGGVRVHASEKYHAKVTTGGGAIGGVAGAGGSVSVADVVSNVDAAILGTTQTTVAGGKVEVIAETARLDGASDAALKVKAVQVAGGYVGLGAAVVSGTMTHNVNAAIGSGTQTTVTRATGPSIVQAIDSTDVEALAVGATAGLNIAAGAVIARSRSDGEVAARLGDSGAAPATALTLNGGALNISSMRNGDVTAEARAGAGGVFSGAGADAGAADSGRTQARLGNAVTLTVNGGDAIVTADAAPDVSAKALGTGVGGVTVGVALANADASVDVNAGVGTGSKVSAGDFVLQANRSSAGHAARAQATGIAGGALLGVNATISNTHVGGSVGAAVGDDVTIAASGNASVTAYNNSAQHADASGVTVGGVLAVGANIANALADTLVSASTGARLGVTGDEFTVNATSNDATFAKAKAGSGGVVSGPGASARTTHNTTTSATTGAGDASHAIEVNTVKVGASQYNQFAGEVDSVNAAVYGASGSTALHDVNSTVSATIGAGAVVRANTVRLEAGNFSEMKWLASSNNGDTAPWNIRSGSGGALNAAAASSTTHITHNTTAAVGDGALVSSLTAGGIPAHFDIDASNDIAARNKVLLDGGGVIALSLAFAKIYVDEANATVRFGENAQVANTSGNINAGANGRAVLDARAVANVYGLAGEPSGEAFSIYNGNNTIVLRPGALLRAGEGAVFLAAGQSSSGLTSGVAAHSDVHLWNKTAAPIVTTPDARSFISSNASVITSGGSVIESAGDISLLAEKGGNSATFIGVGKDLYRAAGDGAAYLVSNLFGGGDVTFDVTGGQSRISGFAQVLADGTARTGIDRNQSLTLDYQLVDANGNPSVTPVVNAAGEVLWQLRSAASKGVTYTISRNVGIGQDIQARIDKLRTLQDQYASDAASVAAYGNEIDFLQNKLVQLGLANYDAQGNFVPGASNPTADFVRVNDITARLGNINTSGDRLAGSGVLSAPGDAQITITNNTPNFLELKKLTISSNEGGFIRFNGSIVNSNADIERLNPSGLLAVGAPAANFSSVTTRDTQGAAAPAITINSNYNPNSPLYANLPAPAPDIQLNGDINNLRGSVTVLSKAGSILSSGAINAGTVNVKADNGDFVQSFVNGFNHAGGDPASIEDFGTPLGAGIVANGSVLISARFLNINSLVQSGIENWNVNIGQSPVVVAPAAVFALSQAERVTINAQKIQYQAAKISGFNPNPRFTFMTANGPQTYLLDRDLIEATVAYVDADRLRPDWATRTAPIRGLYALASNTGSTGNIDAFYNPVQGRIELNGAAVRGGYIQLYGQILNTTDTGAAKLRVLDGYGQISVYNESGIPVVLNNLDAGVDPTGANRGIAGTIDITDIRSTGADGSANVKHTVLTRDYTPGTTSATIRRFSEDYKLLPNGARSATTPPDNGNDGNSTDDRSTRYDPQSGIRYVWTTATDKSTTTKWTFESNQYFGSQSLRSQPRGTVISKGSPVTLGTVRLDDGTYVDKNLTTYAQTQNPLYPRFSSQEFILTPTTQNASRRLFQQTLTLETGEVWTKTSERTNCTWYTVCIQQKWTADYTQRTGTQTITTKSLKADYPIAIEFSGYNTGSVRVNALSDIVVSGVINNRSGTTLINAGDSGDGLTAANRNIVQGSNASLIASKSLTLTASGSVGAAAPNSTAVGAIQTNVMGAGGVLGQLTASAANGNIFVHQTDGNLSVGSVIATGDALQGLGQVSLRANGDISGVETLSGNLLSGFRLEQLRVQGNRVELTSDNGAIGSIAKPFMVNVGAPIDVLQRGYYGVTASAQGDVGIQARTWSGNTNGDLLLNTVVSRAGDVKLVAPGRIIDNNPVEQIDTRTWNELLGYWDSLSLRANTASNTARQQEAVRAYESGKTQDYLRYWQLRQRQANPAAYDAAFVYTATTAERDALAAAGLNATQITQFEASRTTQYHQLHAEVGALNSGVFSDGYRYVAVNIEQNQLLKGSSWTERELGIAVTPALLKDITNTNPVVKAANAQGRRVTLEAGTAIGETQSAITIAANVLPENLTNQQKVALSSAERADVDASDPSQIVLRQRKPVNFDASIALSTTVAATAKGHPDAGDAYLASLTNARIDTLQVPRDLRLKVSGSIINETTATPDVQARNVILEAASGGIGFVPSDGVNAAVAAPLRLKLAANATLTARASENVDINETSGSLNIDTVFSRKDVQLAAQGSILDAHAPLLAGGTVRESELNVLGGNLALIARNGSVGNIGNALDVGINVDGSISATASTSGQDIYLNGPIGRNMRIGAVNSGGVIDLRAPSDMTVGGLVSGAGAVTLVAGGAMTMTPSGAIRATTQGIVIDANTLTMQDGASIRADSGSINIRTTGDAVITGIETGNSTDNAITITSTTGRIQDGGDTRLDIVADTPPGATLTINGALGVGNDPLDVRLLNLQATSGGVVDIAVTGPVNIVAVNAADRVLLSASGNMTGGNVTSSGSGGIADKSISVTSTGGNVNLATVNGASDVGVQGKTGVTLGTVATSNGNTSVGAAAGNVAAGMALASNGSVNLSASGNIDATNVLASKNVSMVSTAGAINAGDVSALSGTGAVNASGNINLGKGVAATQFVVDSSRGNVSTSSLTADGISLMGAGAVTGSGLAAGSSLVLRGGTIEATATGAGGMTGGAITGYNGGSASNVLVMLNNPAGYSFSDVLVTNGTITAIQGEVAIANIQAGNKLTVSSPLITRVYDPSNSTGSTNGGGSTGGSGGSTGGTGGSTGSTGGSTGGTGSSTGETGGSTGGSGGSTGGTGGSTGSTGGSTGGTGSSTGETGGSTGGSGGSTGGAGGSTGGTGGSAGGTGGSTGETGGSTGGSGDSSAGAGGSTGGTGGTAGGTGSSTVGTGIAAGGTGGAAGSSTGGTGGTATTGIGNTASSSDGSLSATPAVNGDTLAREAGIKSLAEIQPVAPSTPVPISPASSSLISFTGFPVALGDDLTAAETNCVSGAVAKDCK